MQVQASSTWLDLSWEALGGTRGWQSRTLSQVTLLLSHLGGGGIVEPLSMENL